MTTNGSAPPFRLEAEKKSWCRAISLPDARGEETSWPSMCRPAFWRQDNMSLPSGGFRTGKVLRTSATTISVFRSSDLFEELFPSRCKMKSPSTEVEGLFPITYEHSGLRRDLEDGTRVQPSSSTVCRPIKPSVRSADHFADSG